MFVERLLNQGNAPLLTQLLKFTAARHRLIAENVVNLSTPNYRQKDLSLESFQQALRNQVDRRHDAPPGRCCATRATAAPPKSPPATPPLPSIS